MVLIGAFIVINHKIQLILGIKLEAGKTKHPNLNHQ
jgi:hypothetical protein